MMHKLAIAVFVAAIILFSALEIYITARDRGKIDGSKDGKSLNLIAHLRNAAVVIGIASSIFPVIRLPFGRDNDFIIGAVFIIIGAMIRFMAISALGESFTAVVMVRENQKIKKDGLYKYVRHPAYFGGLLFFSGYGIGMGSLIGLVLIVTVMFYGLHRRMVVEETVLISAFGDEYGDYMKRTKKIIPLIY
jgi:protein-S-isoprenylcysteine O-methyltransferase Ste14